MKQSPAYNIKNTFFLSFNLNTESEDPVYAKKNSPDTILLSS